MKPFLFACALAMGCAADPPSEAEFRAALPPAYALEIAVPGAGGATRANSGGVGVRSSALIGQIADFYALTRIASAQLNGQVGSVAGTISGIAQSPPSAVGPDQAMWGPFTPTLSPVNYRLVVARVAPGAYAFHLAGRPKLSADDAAFQPLVQGASTPAPDRNAGSFQLNLQAAHALDPVAVPRGGAAQASYAMTPAGGSVRFQIAPEGIPPADYRYDQAANGAGDFRFATPDAIVRSRWTPGGAGRADANVTGGMASECWNDAFARVFYRAPDGASEGDPAACVYPDPLPPDL